MSEDLRSRYRRDYTNEPIRQRPAAPKPALNETVKPIPAAAPPSDTKAETPLVLPLSTITEPAAPKHPRKHKRRPSVSKKLLITLALLLIVASGAGVGYYKFHKDQTSGNQAYFPPSIISQVSIPLYYPINLPSGYKVNNDYKVLQQNVVYYSIKDAAANRYAVTIQPLPTSFDFNQFKGKFLKPDEFSTTIGSALVGTAGANLIASIRTDDNSWVIINASNTNTQTQLETIVRSLHKSK